MNFRWRRRPRANVSQSASHVNAKPPKLATTSHAHVPSRFVSSDDVWLFNEGAHTRLYERLGAQLVPDGVVFGVWAPNAEQVSVVGDFNDWNVTSHPLVPQHSSGIWQQFVPEVLTGARYKFHIVSDSGAFTVDKADPFAAWSEVAPRTASVVWDTARVWHDEEWMATRPKRNALDAPMSVYELHVGSWRHVDDDNRSLTFRELAEPLARYVNETGYTHVELMPITEHPFYGSWGYQTTGYFAPTSRFGTPQDFMELVDVLHQNGIGVILDWVPSHFPSDEHGLGLFDGTHLFEHADPRMGFHPDWKTLIFNYDRYEVCSFLLSSAHCWLDRYHVDGIRVDAVASMLYLDYSRGEGEWIPNVHGGNENLGALQFLRKLNETIYADFPDVQTFAEESTSWPMVSRPTDMGGLGFGLKWDMGWMHDTLDYFAHEPIHRRFSQDQLTFRMVYAFSENFMLPLSHDEVVHGKGSLLAKMPGDSWQKFANLRALFGYQFALPGKKLLFMGDDIAADVEWNHDAALPWHLLESSGHAGVHQWVTTMNRLHRTEAALHEVDFDADGFEWVDASDADASILAFLRHPKRDGSGDPVTSEARSVLIVCNLTPVPRENYLIGVPAGGRWIELANSDAEVYGGSGWGNYGAVDAVEPGTHGRPFALPLVLAPLGVTFFAPEAS